MHPTCPSMLVIPAAAKRRAGSQALCAWLLGPSAFAPRFGPLDQIAPSAPSLTLLRRNDGEKGGGHALVLRDDRTMDVRGADGVPAIPQDEGFRAAGVCSWWGFLRLAVGLRFGQVCRRGLCANHRVTAADHLKRCGDVEHEHRKHSQRRIDPAIERRRGYQPSVRVFVPCHGLDNTSAQRPVSSAERYPPFSGARALGLLGVLKICPAVLIHLHPPKSPSFPTTRSGEREARGGRRSSWVPAFAGMTLRRREEREGAVHFQCTLQAGGPVWLIGLTRAHGNAENSVRRAA